METLDREVMESVSRVLGREVWSKALIVLTHGDTKSLSEYETFCTQRAAVSYTHLTLPTTSMV